MYSWRRTFSCKLPVFHILSLKGSNNKFEHQKRQYKIHYSQTLLWQTYDNSLNRMNQIFVFVFQFSIHIQCMGPNKCLDVTTRKLYLLKVHYSEIYCILFMHTINIRLVGVPAKPN